MYVGLPGTGKTLSMVEYLMRLQAEQPDIKVYSNFGYKYQTGEINTLDDLYLINDPAGVVFAVDEVQLSFQARQFGAFPSEMIFLLTQNRKFKKHFVCTAQLFEHVDKVFRDLTNLVVECKNWGSRMFFQKAYLSLDYRRQVSDPLDTKGFTTFTMWSYFFVATNEIYEAYDTYKVVESFKREREKSDVSLGNMLDKMRQLAPEARGATAPQPRSVPSPVKTNIQNVRFV